jgi:MFS family permease
LIDRFVGRIIGGFMRRPNSLRRGQWAAFSFLFGNAVSMVGNALVLVALPWFVIETTGSAARTGMIGMISALPALTAGILGGVLVDRFGGRRMSVISDLISGVAVALIPFLYQTTGLSFWTLMLLVFIGAAFDIPGVTAKRLLLPDLARDSGMRDEAMTSAYETTQGASWIVGPLLAGVLIALIGTVNLLWITAGGFIISAICIGLFSPEGRHVHSLEDGALHLEVGALAEIKAGLRYLRTDSFLLSLAFGLTLMNFLNGPFWSVVVPIQIEWTYGHASRFGLLLTMLGIGSLLGGIGYGALGHRFRKHRRLIYLLGVTSFPALLWVFVANVSFPWLVAASLVAGLLSGPINPLLVTVRLERIPPALRGRVFSTFSGLASAAIPLGMILAGWLLEFAGIRTGLVVIALIATAFTLALWLTRPLHEMDEEPAIEKVPTPAERSTDRDYGKA